MAARLNPEPAPPDLIDLRRISARELDPLLREEIAAWRADLDWEFDKSADLILSTFIDEALQEESCISISSVKIRRASPLPLFTTPVNCHVGLIGAPSSLSLAREEDEVGFSTLGNMLRTIENAI